MRLQFVEGNKSTSLCTGIALSSKFVLTARHCVDRESVDEKTFTKMFTGLYDIRKITISQTPRVGESYTQSADLSTGEISWRAIRSTNDSDTAGNDWVILNLSGLVNIRSHMRENYNDILNHINTPEDLVTEKLATTFTDKSSHQNNEIIFNSQKVGMYIYTFGYDGQNAGIFSWGQINPFFSRFEYPEYGYVHSYTSADNTKGYGTRTNQYMFPDSGAPLGSWIVGSGLNNGDSGGPVWLCPSSPSKCILIGINSRTNTSDMYTSVTAISTPLKDAIRTYVN